MILMNGSECWVWQKEYKSRAQNAEQCSRGMKDVMARIETGMLRWFDQDRILIDLMAQIYRLNVDENMI